MYYVMYSPPPDKMGTKGLPVTRPAVSSQYLTNSIYAIDLPLKSNASVLGS